MKKALVFILLGILIGGCAEQKEYIMPFSNFGYTGDRLFPVSKSDAEFEFRAWVNFSTSIDRVFTVSRSKSLGDFGNLIEIKNNAKRKNKRSRSAFKQINISPVSGFEKFIQKVDSLQLINLKDQDSEHFNPALHQPFSIYVIEIKSHNKINQFRFNTYFPGKNNVEQIYEEVQKLIFSEFNFKIYHK